MDQVQVVLEIFLVHQPIILNLKKKLANVHNKEAALVFASAYTANQSTLWTLGKKLKILRYFLMN